MFLALELPSDLQGPMGTPGHSQGPLRNQVFQILFDGQFSYNWVSQFNALRLGVRWWLYM